MDCKYCGNAMLENQGRYECGACGWTTTKPIENLDNLLYLTGEGSFFGGTAMPWRIPCAGTQLFEPVYLERWFPKRG